MINKSDIEFLPIGNVDSLALSNFYSSVFPESKEKSEFMRQWVNNFPKNGLQAPLVALYNKRVVAHAGIVPFNIFFKDKEYSACWFVDFAVLEEFRNQGIGSLITNKLMQVSDLSFALAAEKSRNIFKRCGLIESFDTYLLLYPLNLFFHPKLNKFMPYFLQSFLNKLGYNFFKKKYNKSSSKPLVFSSLTLEKIKVFSKSLKRSDEAPTTLHNCDYLSWRLLESLDKDKYRFLESGAISAIIKLGSKDKGSYLDILCLSDLSNNSLVADLLTDLGLWGLNNGFSYMRQYTSSKRLADYLLEHLEPTLRKPPFLFYAKDKLLLEQIKKSQWCFEFIDSDFELM